MDHQASDHSDPLHDAADLSRLLDGENPDSTDPQDTLLWVGVYGELLELTGKLPGKMDAEVVRLGEAVRELSKEMTLIERKQRRYRRRLTYWEAKARESHAPVVVLKDAEG